MRNASLLIIMACVAGLGSVWGVAAEVPSAGPAAVTVAVDERVAALEKQLGQLEARIEELEQRPTIQLQRPLQVAPDQPHLGPQLRRGRRPGDPYDTNIFFLKEIEAGQQLKIESQFAPETHDISDDQ
ncbi:hypothetical protein ACERK3_17130 [Phycisphaerales bacterium AB-hyl4]|uniref:Uncharacterized protein n=1 Tax=Natronomicrosphaera hydrolytica TaxID=3242702 RepID=A0ABV4U8S2_9BACT